MKKATNKKKEMTIEDLALMVAKRFDTIEESMITKDESSKSFAEVEKSLNKIRMDMLDIGDKFVSNYRFEELVSRFNILEAKVKGKK